MFSFAPFTSLKYFKIPSLISMKRFYQPANSAGLYFLRGPLFFGGLTKEFIFLLSLISLIDVTPRLRLLLAPEAVEVIISDIMSTLPL